MQALRWCIDNLCNKFSTGYPPACGPPQFGKSLAWGASGGDLSRDAANAACTARSNPAPDREREREKPDNNPCFFLPRLWPVKFQGCLRSTCPHSRQGIQRSFIPSIPRGALCSLFFPFSITPWNKVHPLNWVKYLDFTLQSTYTEWIQTAD